jgi:hypothetical protein
MRLAISHGPRTRLAANLGDQASGGTTHRGQAVEVVDGVAGAWILATSLQVQKF